MKKPAKSTSGQGMGALPSVSEVDRYLEAQGLPHGKPVREQVQRVLAGFRDQLRGGAVAKQHCGGSNPAEGETGRQAVLEAIANGVSRPPPHQLRPVINATGVVVHTNLGRAVLSPELLSEALPLLGAYTNLEFDLSTGKRGGRGGRVPELLAQLAGAEAGLVVNNNAAAVLLMLSALAAGREVIVSRGELVEIGGAFRVPDIMRQSGVKLVEVGSTNRTRLADYADAITPDTAALLKVHRSNFAMTGFVEETGVAEMAGLATEKGLGVWHDLGSGNFYRFQQPALRSLPTVDQELRAGADVLTLSGDKLLGSVQAGIVVGKEEPLARMRRHPLYRSLRMDKLRSALLEQSLLDYLSFDDLRRRNPVIECMERTVADMEPVARGMLRKLNELGKPGGLSWTIEHGHSLVGGGAVPEARMETVCLALESPGSDGEALAKRLRDREPPIIARIQEGRVLLDFRTLFDRDLPHVEAAILALATAG